VTEMSTSLVEKAHHGYRAVVALRLELDGR